MSALFPDSHTPSFHPSSHCTWWKVGCGSLGRGLTYARGVTIFWTEIVTHSWACAQGNIVPQEILCQLLFGTDPRLFDSSRKDNQINMLTLHIHMSVLNARLHTMHRGRACDVHVTSSAGNFCMSPHTSVYAPPSWEAMNREIVRQGLVYKRASRYGTCI